MCEARRRCTTSHSDEHAPRPASIMATGVVGDVRGGPDTARYSVLPSWGWMHTRPECEGKVVQGLAVRLVGPDMLCTGEV